MEAVRIFNVDVKDIVKNFIDAVIKIVSEFKVICVLKGLRMIIIDGDEVFINVFGNSGMVKGGSGDVLIGIILFMIV